MRQSYVLSWESASYDIKTLREDRHGLEENWADETIRRRRRTPRESPFFIWQYSEKTSFQRYHTGDESDP